MPFNTDRTTCIETVWYFEKRLFPHSSIELKRAFTWPCLNARSFFFLGEKLFCRINYGAPKEKGRRKNKRKRGKNIRRKREGRRQSAAAFLSSIHPSLHVCPWKAKKTLKLLVSSILHKNYGKQFSPAFFQAETAFLRWISQKDISLFQEITWVPGGVKNRN